MKSILKLKSTKTITTILLCIFTLFCLSTIAYSAFSSTMNITGIAHSRVEADVRITDFALHEIVNATSAYEEFGKNTISSSVQFKTNSYVVYRIEVTNYGEANIGIKEISGKNSKLTYELINYNLKDKICDSSQKCNNYAVKEFYLKIYGTSGTYDINLSFDFQPFLSITYKNLSNNNYPTEILYGELLNINIGANNAPGIIVKSGTAEYDNYSYNNGILIVPTVKENLVIEKLSYESSYLYTGNYQEFTAPYDGIYRIQLWGAQGGNIGGIGYDQYDNVVIQNVTYTGGLGAYTAGNIALNSGDKLYFYVGSTISQTNVTMVGGISEGGWNGGGFIRSDQNIFGVGGGGATDVRIIPGTADSFDSLKSRIMVAGGGGGANFRNQMFGEGNGGDGGGLVGYNGYVVAGRHGRTDYPSGYDMGTGGTQIIGGHIEGHALSGTISTSSVKGGFGKPPADFNAEQSGGGAGYYNGSFSGHAGAGGGSSFISGHDGCDAIDESSTESNIIHTSQSIHYSGFKFTDTVMIDGVGYKWTNKKESYVGMPSYDGSSIIKGNTGNGYAKITFKEMIKKSNEQIEVTSVATQTTNDATSSDEKYNVSSISSTISLNSSTSYVIYQIDVTNSGTKNMAIKSINNFPSELTYELADYTLKENISSQTKKTIYLKISGTPGKYNLELNFEFIPVQSITYINIPDNNYQQYAVTGDTLVVNIGSSNAPGILVKIGDNLIDNYSYQNGILTVPNVTDDIVIEGFSYKITYGYKGNYETFTTPYNGVYKVELWGASGEDKNDYRGGYGAYVSGLIELEQNTNLYIYVGSDTGQFNGKSLCEADYGSGGGGSTDVRLTSGSWKDFESLKSRIIVAGAGGGGDNRTSGYGDGIGGDAGGLIGYDGESINHTNGYGYSNSYGGTQTKAYLMYWNNLGGATTPTGFRDLTGYVYKGVEYSNAGFGSGGTSQSGGGSGYYGGAGGDHSGGAGGSSFISGHNGCDAIAESSTSTNITHTGQSIHYSNYYFTNTTMIDGQGYSWTTEKGSLTGMPTHDGTGTMIGNKGAGYIKITLIEIKK